MNCAAPLPALHRPVTVEDGVEVTNSRQSRQGARVRLRDRQRTRRGGYRRVDYVFRSLSLRAQSIYISNLVSTDIIAHAREERCQ